jgi:hypothetical protein
VTLEANHEKGERKTRSLDEARPKAKASHKRLKVSEKENAIQKIKFDNQAASEAIQRLFYFSQNVLVSNCRLSDN